MEESASNNTALETFVLGLMRKEYSSSPWQQHLIFLLSIASALAFYPLAYMLFKVHKQRGFDIVLSTGLAVS